MNDIARNGNLTINGTTYRFLRLLGKGKGGYSYLAERDGRSGSLKRKKTIGRENAKKTPAS